MDAGGHLCVPGGLPWGEAACCGGAEVVSHAAGGRWLFLLLPASGQFYVHKGRAVAGTGRTRQCPVPPIHLPQYMPEITINHGLMDTLTGAL